jgi:hypothetical protein
MAHTALSLGTSAVAITLSLPGWSLFSLGVFEGSSL